MSEKREAELRPAILDVIHFGDGSRLKLEVLAPRGLRLDQASEAYYRIKDLLDELESVEKA